MCHKWFKVFVIDLRFRHEICFFLKVGEAMSDEKRKYQCLGSNVYQIGSGSKIPSFAVRKPSEDKLGRLLMTALKESRTLSQALQRKFHFEIQQLESALKV